MKLSTLFLTLLLSSCAQAHPQTQPPIVTGPLVDTQQSKKVKQLPVPLLPSDFQGGNDHNSTIGIQLDVIHNNVNQLKKRIDDRNEKNTHDDEQPQ